MLCFQRNFSSPNRINKKQNISLIGPYANNTAITGSWSIFSDRDKNTTLLEAFKNNNFENVLYSKGSEILRTSDLNKILLAEGENLIYTENEKELEEKMIEEAKNILISTGADHRSISVFDDMVRFRETKDYNDLPKLDKKDDQYFPRDILQYRTEKISFVDCGAYTGDTFRTML